MILLTALLLLHQVIDLHKIRVLSASSPGHSRLVVTTLSDHDSDFGDATLIIAPYVSDAIIKHNDLMTKI